MKELSDKVERKFIESFDIDDFEIFTDDGWVDAKAIHKTVKYNCWIVVLKHRDLICADTHIVFDENMEQIFVKDLKPGMYIQTDSGLEQVIDIIETLYDDNMYDIELVEESNHRYYTNGILSHNTTSYTVFCMWLATLFPEKKIMICANKLQTSLEIMDRLRTAYEYLPEWIKPGVTTYNKGEIEFSNLSSIKAFSTSSSAARGQSGNVIIIDEMAFIPKNIIDEFFASVMPVISSSKNSKAIIVSTPNGAEGLYYDIWQAANSKDKGANEEGWKPFQIRWFETGGIRDEAWKRQQIATVGIEKWKQEFECDFLTSATKRLIPDDILEKYRINLSELKTKSKDFLEGKIQQIVSEDQSKLYEFTMWHEFDPKCTYAASGDISEGTGGDSSVLYIWDITDLREIRMCAKFSSSTVSVVEFAFIATKILHLYNDPYFIAERNGISGGMLDSMRLTYGYQNIVTEGKNKEPGVFSHISIKGKACLWAREMLTTEGFGFKIYDKELINEFNTFVKKDTKGVYLVYTALPGAHDDHVISFIWLCYILQSEIIEKYYFVCKTFTSALGNIYAQIVQPQKEYTGDQIKKITNDPMYQEFLDFKNSVLNKLSIAMQQEQAERDNFIWHQQQDMYFGGRTDEPSWNTPTNFNPSAEGLNPNNRMPSFFII